MVARAPVAESGRALSFIVERKDSPAGFLRAGLLRCPHASPLFVDATRRGCHHQTNASEEATVPSPRWIGACLCREAAIGGVAADSR